MGLAQKVAIWICSVIQVGVAIAISYTIATKLSHLEFTQDGQIREKACALDDTVTGDDATLCQLGYVGVGITFGAMLALSILQCCTCDLCGAGWIFDAVLQGVLCAGWVCYASWVTEAKKNIESWDEVKDPEWNTVEAEDGRTLVFVLSWVEAGMLGLLALFNIVSGCSCCCPDSKDRYK
eukprot:TRINITY_DN3919_c0_g1_i1.p2 TRINITY_DN3919_c0_g1~~TRINITY_DN3919_c0_g1_i1.p2  ORF type:complete len:211 (+),score=5.65 TRINITY_DN3919_c0_g1_i1:94-633(+)